MIASRINPPAVPETAAMKFVKPAAMHSPTKTHGPIPAIPKYAELAPSIPYHYGVALTAV